jgi:hypothetical protein
LPGEKEKDSGELVMYVKKDRKNPGSERIGGNRKGNDRAT